MNPPPRKPGVSESATLPGAAPDASPTRGGGFDPAAPVPPELIDHPRYRVLALLGQGGMGAVYKAEHKRMERAVALKVINPALVNHPSAVQRFHQEVRAAAKLQHPHIVTAFDADQAGALHFLVMEFIEGESLMDYLQRRGPLPAAEACDYARQAALGLQHAHEKGMVHRDVKPHNLMRTPEGQIKILDFGLARLGRAAQAVTEETLAPTDGSAATAQLTGMGTVMGTADYIAPEQAGDAHNTDGRADVYSLGCTLYHLLTGRPPFAGGSPLEKVVRHAVEPPVPPEQVRPDLPAGLGAVVLKMLAKKPDDRYRTPAEVADALAPFLHGGRRFSVPRTGVVLAVLLVVALAAVVVYPLATNRPGAGITAGPGDDSVAAAATPDSAAADGLRPDQLSEEELVWAGDGDSTRVVPQLADVFGDVGFRVPGVPGFVDYSPDGSLLAVPAGDNVLVFNAESGRRLRTLIGHKTRAYRAAFSPNGKMLASAGLDGAVILWDPQTGRKVREMHAADGMALHAVAFSRDSALLATGGAAGVVRLWDAASAAEIPTQGGPHTGPVDALAFSPDGKTLASAGEDGTVRIWDLTGKKIGQMKLDDGGSYVSVGFSRDGGLLAAGSGGRVAVWDGRSFQQRWSDKAAAGGLTAFTPDGAALLTTPYAYQPDQLHSFTRWDAHDGKQLDVLSEEERGHSGACRLTPDGKTLAAVDDALHVVRLYDAANGRPRVARPGHVRAVKSVAVSPDGKTLASAGDDGVVKLWDLATGAELRTLTGHVDAVECVAFNPDGTLLASGGLDKTIRLWDIPSGRRVGVLTGHTDAVERVVFSPDGKRLASAGQDHTVRFWDPATGDPLGFLEGHAQPVRGLGFSPRGLALASTDEEGVINLWDVAQGRKMRTLKHASRQWDAVWPHDGKTLASAGADGCVHLWDLKQFTEVRTLRGPAADVVGLALQPTGDLLAAACLDGTVRVWDLADAAARPARLAASSPDDAVLAVAFTPDGRHLIAGAVDGTIVVYRLAPPGKKGRLPDSPAGTR